VSFLQLQSNQFLAMPRMGHSCKRESLCCLFAILMLLVSTAAGQNTTRAPEYQLEGCLRCGQPCLQAAENTLLPCITAAVGEAMACESDDADGDALLQIF